MHDEDLSRNAEQNERSPSEERESKPQGPASSAFVDHSQNCREQGEHGNRGHNIAPMTRRESQGGENEDHQKCKSQTPNDVSSSFTAGHSTIRGNSFFHYSDSISAKGQCKTTHCFVRAEN
jgi:hypothetical protein